MEEKHPETLEKQIERAEQEARMVLPGIQALFGFQLIAAFNNSFFEKIGTDQRVAHFIAILLTTLATLSILIPAAYHRQAEIGWASRRFLLIASRCIGLSMAFLALSLLIDINIIGTLVFESSGLSNILTGVLFILFPSGWYVFPHLCRAKED